MPLGPKMVGPSLAVIAKKNHAQAVTCYIHFQPESCAMTKAYRSDIQLLTSQHALLGLHLSTTFLNQSKSPPDTLGDYKVS